MKTFEEYLRDNVWEPEGILDDYMPDAFDNWCAELDVQEVMDYADDYRIFITNKLKDLVQTYTNPKTEFDGITWSMICEKVK